MVIVALVLSGCDPELPEAGKEEAQLAKSYIQTPFNILYNNVDMAVLADAPQYGDSIVVEYPKTPFSRYVIVRNTDEDFPDDPDSLPTTPSIPEDFVNFIQINLEKEGFHFVVKGSSYGLVGTNVAGLQVDAHCRVRGISIDEYFSQPYGSGGVISGTVFLYDENQKRTAQIRMKNLKFSFNDIPEMVYSKGDVIFKPMGISQELQVIPSLF